MSVITVGFWSRGLLGVGGKTSPNSSRVSLREAQRGIAQSIGVASCKGLVYSHGSFSRQPPRDIVAPAPAVEFFGEPCVIFVFVSVTRYLV